MEKDDRKHGPAAADSAGDRGSGSGRSEARHAEHLRRRLRTAERRFRSIIQTLADGILVVDAKAGEIRFANKAAGRLFGRDPEQLIGSPFGAPLVVGEITEIDLVRNGRPVVAELRVMETEWEGEQARLVSLRNITERKETEEQARELVREQVARAEAEEAARRAEFLAEAARRLSSSLALEEPLQDVVELIATDFADYCLLDLIDGVEVQRFAAVREGGSVQVRPEELKEYPVRLDAETPQARAFEKRQPVLVRNVEEGWLERAAQDEAHADLLRRLRPRSILFVPLDSGRDCLGLLSAVRTRAEPFRDRDLHLATELGRHLALAVDNARLYRDAEAANQAKANFLSVMSHELRTPLSAIIGYTDLLDRGVVGEVSDKQSEYLGRIRASSNHLLQIIEEILSFAGTEAGKDEIQVEDVTLGELMDGVEAVAGPLAAETGLDFEIQIEDGGERLTTDERKVRQIVLNLVSNGLKFTEEGSVVVRARLEGDQLVVDVADTGIGIPQDKQERIFERFSQLEEALTRKAGGTGLGLTVGRSFAQLLGGTLTVESEPGAGSTFTLRIPRHVEQPGDD